MRDHTESGAYVSALSHMCEYHESDFARLAAMVVDCEADDVTKLRDIGRYLREWRATCRRDCGVGDGD